MKSLPDELKAKVEEAAENYNFDSDRHCYKAGAQFMYELLDPKYKELGREYKTTVQTFSQRVHELEKIQCDLEDDIEALQAKNQRLVDAMLSAKQKLQIYREHSSGEYKGGMEYMMLINKIDKALAAEDGES